MMKEDRIDDVGIGTQNPFADNAWYGGTVGKHPRVADPSADYNRVQGSLGISGPAGFGETRVDEPLQKARNMPGNLPELSYMNAAVKPEVQQKGARGKSDASVYKTYPTDPNLQNQQNQPTQQRPKSVEQQGFQGFKDKTEPLDMPAGKLAAGDQPSAFGFDSAPSQIDMMYRMRMPDAIQPPTPPPGGAVSAWSAMMQNLNKVAGAARPPKISIQEAQPAHFLDAPFSGIKKEDAQQGLSPDYFISSIRQETPVRQAPPVKPLPVKPFAYAGKFCAYEGDNTEITLSATDKLVKLPSADRSNGVDITFPNAIVVKLSGVYYVNYELNIRSAENCGMITLSLLVNGKQEAGHIHPFALCEMPAPTPIIDPTVEQNQAQQATVVLPEAAPIEPQTLAATERQATPEPSIESGYLRLHWQGFMTLSAGAHLSMKITSTHNGVLHMDAGRHTFINALLVESLNNIDELDDEPDNSVPQPPSGAYGPAPQPAAQQ